MHHASIIGLDPAKRVFQLHRFGADEHEVILDTRPTAIQTGAFELPGINPS